MSKKIHLKSLIGGKKYLTIHEIDVKKPFVSSDLFPPSPTESLSDLLLRRVPVVSSASNFNHRPRLHREVRILGLLLVSGHTPDTSTLSNDKKSTLSLQNNTDFMSFIQKKERKNPWSDLSSAAHYNAALKQSSPPPSSSGVVGLRSCPTRRRRRPPILTYSAVSSVPNLDQSQSSAYDSRVLTSVTSISQLLSRLFFQKVKFSSMASATQQVCKKLWGLLKKGNSGSHLLSDLDSLTIPAKISGEFHGSMVGKFRPVYLYDREKMSEIVLRLMEDSIANSFNATPGGRSPKRGCTLEFKRVDELPTNLSRRPDRLLLDNDCVYKVKTYRNEVELPNFLSKNKLESPTRRLYVENLPQEVENEGVKTLFSQYGLVGIHIFKRTVDAIATVEFSTFEGAHEAFLRKVNSTYCMIYTKKNFVSPLEGGELHCCYRIHSPLENMNTHESILTKQCLHAFIFYLLKKIFDIQSLRKRFELVLTL
ncbi:hypothetical protein F8388_022516 [Cannabis sativa]|uniref:RRM domain-containing protein n=1 Tax=Cannabis sativa TaxID=3483 RepID=A0A7J6EM03_CANSA|nr:hypothetical protein F8388_022516 [Cannabis sativa]